MNHGSNPCRGSNSCLWPAGDVLDDGYARRAVTSQQPEPSSSCSSPPSAANACRTASSTRWRVASSAPLGDLEDPANEREGDKLIKTYDEHEDSVYSVAWSCCDAWIFASLSYDGRMVINHVPPAEKYKILL